MNENVKVLISYDGSEWADIGLEKWNRARG
jgi:hypothetical protein